MTQFTEICLEELTLPAHDERFVRCVALPGGAPGLALDRVGQVRWMSDVPDGYGLWTSADGQLILLRGESSMPIVVERGNRTLEAPVGKPVVLVDGDLLRLNGVSFKVHVHGETDMVYPPERLTQSALGRLARAAATAATLALGGVALAAPSKNVAPAKPIEVRLQPPAPMPPRRVITCSIDSQKPVSGKGLQIRATCSDKRGLYVGLHGSLVDIKSGQYVTNGSVQVKTVKGNKIVCEAPKLNKRVRGAQLKFFVYR